MSYEMHERVFVCALVSLKKLRYKLDMELRGAPSLRVPNMVMESKDLREKFDTRAKKKRCKKRKENAGSS
jgi:hypothetical protein